MSEGKYKHKEGDKVYFEMGEKLPSGWGKVCGIVGPIIIIELKEKIPNYPFTHTYIIDSQIKEPPKPEHGSLDMDGSR
jgi:hypothetical protein